MKIEAKRKELKRLEGDKERLETIRKEQEETLRKE